MEHSYASGGLSARRDERLELARFVNERSAILFDSSDEEAKNVTWQIIFDACLSSGHHWTKDKDVSYLKKTRWPGMKRDAIEHFTADAAASGDERKKLTEADLLVLKAVRYDTSQAIKEASPVKDLSLAAALNALTEARVPITVEVEVKEGKPLNLQATLNNSNERNGIDMDLMNKLFNGVAHLDEIPRDNRGRKRTVVEDGPIDHDLMRVLGLDGNNKMHKPEEEGTKRKRGRPPKVIRIPAGLDTASTSETTSDPMLRSLESLCRSNCSTPDDVLHIATIPAHPKMISSPSPLPKLDNSPQATFDSDRLLFSADFKKLNKRALTARILRDEAMTAYYRLKTHKLEFELRRLEQQGK